MPVRTEIRAGLVPVKVFTGELEPAARQQLVNISKLPIVHHHVAAMPEVHLGIGSTVGSVIATKKAIIPAAVGVDIGCGMNAVRLSLKASDLPESLKAVRAKIEALVPTGFSMHQKDQVVEANWSEYGDLYNRWLELTKEFPDFKVKPKNIEGQLGSLGGGNHFIEVCVDEAQEVWVMLHSGSRGVGNAIGRHFIEKAK